MTWDRTTLFSGSWVHGGAVIVPLPKTMFPTQTVYEIPKLCSCYLSSCLPANGSVQVLKSSLELFHNAGTGQGREAS